MNAILLAVGDELVSGLTLDTNSVYLAQQLTALGITIRSHHTLPDQLAPISAALIHAAHEADLVLVTGGLGPTPDDLTRNALAEALREPLIEDASALADLQAFFHARRRLMGISNRLQVQRPPSAAFLPNSCGTAPGLRAVLGQATVYLTPGVPHEMKEMFSRAILPDLRAAVGDRITRITKLNTFGLGESLVGEKIQDLMARDALPNASVGTTVSDGIVSVRIYATGTHAETLATTDALTRTLHQRLGPLIFGQDEQTLQEALASLLVAEHQTLATAESCTGGLLAKFLTDVPGSSAYFHRGWVTYSNRAKSDDLHIPDELLVQHGAVSQPVALAMATHARRLAHTDLALAITGIAGPEGGSAAKPVGTVHIALATPTTTSAFQYLFPGTRFQVRLRAAQTALALLRFHLLRLDPATLLK